MRKLLFILLLFGVAKYGTGQTFAPAGSSWKYCFTGYYPCPGCPLSYETTVNPAGSYSFMGKEIIRLEGISLDNAYTDFYVSGDTTFVFHPEDSSFAVLYNFSFQIGDTLRIDRKNGLFYSGNNDFVRYKVDAVDTMYVQGNPLRYYEMAVEATTLTNYPFCYAAQEKMKVLEQIGLVSMGRVLPLYDCGVADYGVPYLLRYTNSAIPNFYGPTGSCDLGSGNPEKWTGNIFPNPVAGVLGISNPFPEDLYAGLTDIQGRKIKSNIVLTGASTVFLPMEGLSPGVYVISISTKNGTVTRKIIKD